MQNCGADLAAFRPSDFKQSRVLAFGKSAWMPNGDFQFFASAFHAADRAMELTCHY